MTYNQYWGKLGRLTLTTTEVSREFYLTVVHQEKLDTGGFVRTSKTICARREEGVYDEIQMAAHANYPGHAKLSPVQSYIITVCSGPCFSMLLKNDAPMCLLLLVCVFLCVCVNIMAGF